MDIRVSADWPEVKSTDRRAVLMRKYKTLRKIQGRLHGSNYDISNRCNLFCEGCYYFAGGDYKDFKDKDSAQSWGKFFEKEAKRGVNFAYIAGAEPSLEPERLAAIKRHIPNGSIATNGIKKIKPEIDYSIHISVWGDADNVAKYRGADTTTKALENYQGDRRAIMVMTINGQNIDQILNVAAQCADYGLPLTFNYFSATTDYMRLVNGQDHADDYIFNSTQDNNLRHTADTLKRARQQIENAIVKYPNTIVYSLIYDDWMCHGAAVYAVDEHGVATNCGNRLTEHFQHLDVDLHQHTGKCCIPNIDCRDCRAYAPGYASYLMRNRNFRDLDLFEDWLDVLQSWVKIYMPQKYIEAEL